jgi:hypothetical protein
MRPILTAWLAISVMMTLTPGQSRGGSLIGDISGTITVDGTPVGEGVRVEITCGSGVFSALTDSIGRYRVYVSQTGRCALHLTYKGQLLFAAVYSYETPVRYDWSVTTSGGAYQLRRA